MARVNCNYSISASGGESVTRDGYPALRAPYYSSSSDSARSTIDLKITSVQYETTNQTYYIGWECKMYSPGSGGRYSCAAVGAAMGGSYTGSQSGWGTVNLGPYVIMSKTPSSGSYIWNYGDWSSSTVPGSGTYTTTSTSVYLDVRHMMSGGYASDTNHTRWWNGTNGYRRIGSGYLNITAPSIGNPSIDVTHGSTTAASRGSNNGKATVSATASAGTNGGNVSYTISFNGSSKTNGSISATNLKNNTTYSYSGTATNSAGKTASDSGSFYLTPVAPAAPTIGNPTFTRSGNTYSATATVSSSYDTLRAWSSWTSTGLSMSSSTSSSVSYSNLTPNTSYTFSLKTNDKNSSGGAHSAGLSSSATSKTFTTPGNAPTITSHGLSVGGQTSVTMTYSATYDTNSKLSSMRWDYTTGTLPSGATDPTAYNTNTISGLQPNTTYNYRLVVVENVAGRTTTATGTFTTDYPTQQITNMSVQGVGEEFIIVNVDVPNVSWLSKVTCWVYEADGTTLKATQTLTSGIASTNTFTFEALDPGTVYIVKAQITTKGRNTTYNSNIISVEAETLDASPANIIRSDGTVEKHKMYVMGSGNIFNPMKMSWQNGYYTTGAIGDNISSLLNINEGACSTRGIAVIPNISYTIKNTEEGMTYIIHGTDENGVITEAGYTITYGNNYTFTTATNTTRLWVSATSNTEPINHQTVQYYKLNIFRTIEKTVIPKENIVYVNGKIRYIDILAAGSTANDYSHIVELEVYNTAGQNVALNKTASVIKGVLSSNYGELSWITDGNRDTESYISVVPKTPLNLETCVRVDLGEEYTDISHVTLWRYYGDGRTYYNTRILGRDEQERLSWKFHSYKSQGTYSETAEGHTFYMTRQEIVHIPYINSIVLDPENITNTLIGTNIVIDAEPMVFMPEVIDSVESYRIDAILAANQGRLLKQDVGDLTALTTEENSSIVEAINEIWMDFNETSDYSNALNAVLNAPLMV